MRKVWVIEDGEYSDYHVVGVFSSEGNAELVQKSVGGTIAEWDLDPAVAELRRGLTRWQVLMLRDGSTESVKRTELRSYQIGQTAWIWPRSTAPAYAGTGIPDCLNAEVWARNEKHAVKVVNEIRAQKIANGQWPAAAPGGEAKREGRGQQERTDS